MAVFDALRTLKKPSTGIFDALKVAPVANSTPAVSTAPRFGVRDVLKEIPGAAKDLAVSATKQTGKGLKILGKVVTNAPEPERLTLPSGRQAPGIDPTGVYGGINKVTGKAAQALPSVAKPLTQAAKKTVSAVDRLIAEGKIRVVRRGEYDVYQTKLGNKWVNARDESSAVNKVTKSVAPPAPTKSLPAPKPAEARFAKPPEPSPTRILPSAKAISEGEERSLEGMARQLHGASNLPPKTPGTSLPEMVAQTPVKNKVNLLDYLRTPDRVLKKIGLGKESDLVRKQYDSYLKELPKNIAQITEWSKQVPKDASGRIFRYLDGQAVDLAPKEKRVALEIKSSLEGWADRLGLPKEKRVSNYITHLFDDQLIKKEFDEDLAKIIGDKIPGQVYDPFLESRLGAKGYKEDVWGALDAYVKRATRKVHMDRALERLEVASRSLEDSQWKYVKQFADRVNMRPTDIDNLVDNFIKSTPVGYRLGQRPTANITRTARRMVYRAFLGLNPGSAIRNLSQLSNTYAKLGEKHTIAGYMKLFSPQARKELVDEAVLSNNFIQDRNLSSTKKAMEKVDKGLFVFFDTAEKINRGAAYLGAKSKGLAMGKTPEEAVEYAKEIVRKTQFNYDVVDTAAAMQSDLMKTAFQLGTFPMKQSEFLIEMAKNKEVAGLLRYAAAGMTFVYTIGQAIGMEPKELLPTFRFGTPPSLKTGVEVVKALADAPDKFGKDRSTAQKIEDVSKSAFTSLFPAGTQIKKTYEGHKAVQEGGSYTKGGKLQFEVGENKLKKAQAYIFGKYANPEAKEYFEGLENSNLSPEQKRIKDVYEQVQILDSQGKTDESQALVDNLTDAEYETYKDIKALVKKERVAAGVKDMIPVVKEVQRLEEAKDEVGAQALVDDLTDDEYDSYKAAKKQLKEEGEEQGESSFIKDVLTYARAIGTDPVTAFDRIMTGQKIRRVDGGYFGAAIIVERMPVAASQATKKRLGGNTPEFKLDHVIPLELGGSNSETNLKLIPTTEWEESIPVENYLGRLLRENKISKQKAQALIKEFKNDVKTFEQIQQEVGEKVSMFDLRPKTARAAETESEEGTNRPQRNKNPLNIKASDTTLEYPGVVGTDPVPATDGGKFLVFESTEAGRDAAKRLITTRGYQRLTVDKAMKRWSNSGYGGEIVPELSGRPMSSLSDEELDLLIFAMAEREGALDTT